MNSENMDVGTTVYERECENLFESDFVKWLMKYYESKTHTTQISVKNVISMIQNVIQIHDFKQLKYQPIPNLG